eukprot:scaffold119668_cov62-Attheya_sp.AAC.3
MLLSDVKIVAVSLFVTASVFLSFLANITCTAVSFYSPLRGGTTLEFGVFMRKDIAVWEDWEGDPILFTRTCINYDGDIMDPDAKWKTAKAFAIIAIVLGILLPCVDCCMPKFEKPIGACLLLNNAVIDLFNAVIPDEEADKRFPTECSRAMGYNCNIACVIFWFISGMLMIALPEQEKELDQPFQEEDVEEGSTEEKAL